MLFYDFYFHGKSSKKKRTFLHNYDKLFTRTSSGKRQYHFPANNAGVCTCSVCVCMYARAHARVCEFQECTIEIVTNSCKYNFSPYIPSLSKCKLEQTAIDGSITHKGKRTGTVSVSFFLHFFLFISYLTAATIFFWQKNYPA